MDTKTVVIIEDLPDQLQSFAWLLQYSAKYKVHSYSKGSEFLHDLETGKLKITDIDCVVMDFYLGPNEDTGANYIKTFYETWGDSVACVVFSGHQDHRAIIDSINVQVFRWETKGGGPDVVTRLLKSIAEAIEETSNRRKRINDETKAFVLQEKTKKLEMDLSDSAQLSTVLARSHHDAKQLCQLAAKYFNDIFTMPRETTLSNQIVLDNLGRLQMYNEALSRIFEDSMAEYRRHYSSSGETELAVALNRLWEYFLDKSTVNKILRFPIVENQIVMVKYGDLLRVLINLINNADRHAEKIIVSACEYESADAVIADFRNDYRWAGWPNEPKIGHKGRFVCMEIADNGPGIRSDLLPYIFSENHRNKPKVEGHGIGIPSCAKVLSECGGILGIQSTTTGTNVRIIIPLKA